MEKQLTDEEIDLRRKARRRLIGAVVLLIAIVVLLPMVLDNEPRLVGPQNIELRIPDKDKVGEFTPGMEMPPSSGVVSEVSATVAVPVSSSASLPAGMDQDLAASQGMAGENVPVKSAIRHPDGMQGEKNQPGSPFSFVVQAGAFANAGTAYQWQEKLKKQNIKVYTEKVGDKIRVRAGPYATREEAENAYRKLQAQGLEPKVIAH